MRETVGCPYIAGPACADCDGSCWLPKEPDVQPTCADYGHPPAAEDEHGVVFCDCGQPVGEAAGSES